MSSLCTSLYFVHVNFFYLHITHIVQFTQYKLKRFFFGLFFRIIANNKHRFVDCYVDTENLYRIYTKFSLCVCLNLRLHAGHR